MLSTVTRALLILAVIGCADAAAPTDRPLEATRVIAPRAPIRAARGVWRIEAYIDGRSELLFNTYPSNVSWHHFEFAAPGRLLGANLPTRFNDQDWYPEWGDETNPPEYRNCFCYSRLGQTPVAFWPTVYPVAVSIVRSRGTVSASFAGDLFVIGFNDNAIPGADWYIVRVDTRLPIEVDPWPRQNPYVVSLSRDRFVSVALVGDRGRSLFHADEASALSLGDDTGYETPVATSPRGGLLQDLGDVNNDLITDLVARFAISDLLANGDIGLGTRVLTLTASAKYGMVKSAVRVTFVP